MTVQRDRPNEGESRSMTETTGLHKIDGAAEDAHEFTARLQAENTELKDRLLRALADAENVRRRS